MPGSQQSGWYVYNRAGKYVWYANAIVFYLNNFFPIFTIYILPSIIYIQEDQGVTLMFYSEKEKK